MAVLKRFRFLVMFATALLATTGLQAQTVPRPSAESEPDTTSCAALVQRYPGAPCKLDFSRFPRLDVRLQSLQNGRYDAVSPGVVHIARNGAELAAAGQRARPGDQVVLTDGVWRDETLEFRARGDADHPILIRPQTAGGVVLTGRSTLRLVGQHIVVDGLQFRDGRVDRNNFTVISLGGGREQPCDDCTVSRVLVSNYNSDEEHLESWASIYVTAQGRNITIANSVFTKKNNVGLVIHAEHPAANQCGAVQPTDCLQRLQVSGNRFVEISAAHRISSVDAAAKAKVMEIGSGYTASASSFSIIENNLFQNADGGTNTLVIKTSDVLVRRNRFVANMGVINLRSSNRTLVEHNLFDGTARPGMGGVLVQGADHWVLENDFIALTAPLNLYHWPVALSMGAYPELANDQKDYAQARDVVIAGNRFDGVVPKPIALGIYPNLERKRVLPPVNIYVLANGLRTMGANSSGKMPNRLELVRESTRPSSAEDLVVTGNYSIN